MRHETTFCSLLPKFPGESPGKLGFAWTCMDLRRIFPPRCLQDIVTRLKNFKIHVHVVLVEAIRARTSTTSTCTRPSTGARGYQVVPTADTRHACTRAEEDESTAALLPLLLLLPTYCYRGHERDRRPTPYGTPKGSARAIFLQDSVQRIPHAHRPPPRRRLDCTRRRIARRHRVHHVLSSWADHI
jgi:hypothetical protein